MASFDELEATRSLFAEMGWSGLGELLGEQAATGLVRSREVIVVERARLDDLIGNLTLEKESDKARFFDQKTTAAIGRLSGAQAVLFGAITEFEPNYAGGKGGLSLGALAGLRYHANRAVVGVDLRLVDQETGRVLHAGHGRGIVAEDEFGAGVDYKGVKIGGDAWSRTPLGEATRRAVESALVSLLEEMRRLPWEAEVVRVTDAQGVYIDAGADARLQAGDRFSLVRRGAAIRSSDGRVLGYEETPGGWVEVVAVQRALSICRLVTGELPKVGDRVRATGATK